jgi:ribosomal protein L16 Arg81 hydroxylase|tara:strand:+ start:246 stop:458 length:213 start_codon:yes stop_codon:yes gene_type:complete
MKLSDQAIGAIMMALQDSLMNQTDIVPIFKDFHLQLNENEELLVLNPPTINVSDEVREALQEKTSTVGSD